MVVKSFCFVLAAGDQCDKLIRRPGIRVEPCHAWKEAAASPHLHAPPSPCEYNLIGCSVLLPEFWSIVVPQRALPLHAS